GKAGAIPTRIPGKFGVDEIQTVKGMIPVLDAAIKMYAADVAGVTLNGSLFVYDCELFSMGSDRELVAWHDADDGEQCSSGLPALGAAAGMVVGDLGVDANFDGVSATKAT